MKKILNGVWLQTIGHILIAISVSRQIRETDKIKLLEEQKTAIVGDFLVSLGAALEGIGGLQAMEEGISNNIYSIVP
ncbi:hypothetical protein [Cytobacillus firmus]|uniref:hypothetical protein n=1 Tax=Cytobacillus firmus TaxID=1399 RepID=UPI001A7E1F10|nr:hypothetical protein [Cytobacillus firmus]